MPDQPYRDPRIYMAAERTLLAWIRTGLALMGFGFVVARFGLFLREMEAVGRSPVTRTAFSVWFGTALVGPRCGVEPLRGMASRRDDPAP